MEMKQQDDITVPLIVYVLYLTGLFVGVTVIIGLVVAYMQQKTAPEWMKSHYRYLIRTFWAGLVLSIIGFATMWLLVGYLILMITMFWFIFRCVMGLIRLQKREAVKHPDSWLYG